MLLKTILSGQIRNLQNTQQNWINLVGQLNKYFVSIYKIFGFLILAAILFGMVAYLSNSVFFLTSHSWVLPTVLSPSNEKVVAAQQNHLDQTMQLEKLQSELQNIDREIELIEKSLKLNEEVVASAGAFIAATDSNDGPTNEELKKQLSQQLITREEYGRMTNHNRSQKLRQWTAKREALEVWYKNEQLRQSLEPAKRRREFLNSAIAEHKSLLENITQRPHFQASKGPLQAAFIPYENMEGKNIHAGVPIYGCYLRFLFCRNVGTVGKVFAGENLSNHPITGKDIRGQWLDLKMDEESWASSPVLFLGHPPLWL